MRIVNCMKHAANIRLVDGELFTLLPSGNIANVDTSTIPATDVQTEFGTVHTAGKTVYGELTGLPEPVEGVCYVDIRIVSAACFLNKIRREDVATDTNPNM